jgi:hypothetical protein
LEASSETETWLVMTVGLVPHGLLLHHGDAVRALHDLGWILTSGNKHGGYNIRSMGAVEIESQ